MLFLIRILGFKIFLTCNGFNRSTLPYFNTFDISFMLREIPTFHLQHEPSIVPMENKRYKCRYKRWL
jgi:hypothetical protein